jgi:hypothetical protein
MLEDDSSPLDGQQEKTRACHIPVERQQELASHCPAPPVALHVLKIALAFFPFCGILQFRTLCKLKARQTFCRFFISGTPVGPFSKLFRMNTSGDAAFCLLSSPATPL